MFVSSHLPDEQVVLARASVLLQLQYGHIKPHAVETLQSLFTH